MGKNRAKEGEKHKTSPSGNSTLVYRMRDRYGIHYTTAKNKDCCKIFDRNSQGQKYFSMISTILCIKKQIWAV